MFARVVASRAWGSKFPSNRRSDGDVALFLRYKVRHDNATEIEQAKNVGVEQIPIDLNIDIHPRSALRSPSVVD